MDTTQLLLTVTLTMSTIFLIVVGIQLIFVLRELRRTLKKVNNIVEGVEKLGVGLEQGWKELSGFVMGAKGVFKLIDHFHQKKHGKSK